MPGKHGDIYHDPSHPAGYSTPWKLWQATKGPKKDVDTYLQGQDAYTLHRRATRHFPRNVTYADNIDESWQTDLTDLTALKKHNDNHTFVLCVIDVFSKYGWAIPLKDKSASSIVKGFETLFKTTPRRPVRLFSDKGTEYKNKLVQQFLKKHQIQYISTHNPDIKCSIVERWQRTIKSKLFKYFTATENYCYVNGTLEKIVQSYNQTYHRSIKMKPSEVTPDRVLEVYKNLYQNKTFTSQKNKFKVGDYVRISREKQKFEKSYTWNWSEEIFKVIQVIPHTMPVYRLEDLDQDPIEGTFYEMELQKVTKPEAFKIAYIVKSKGKGNTRKHLVHWRGYPEKSRSWILDSDIVKK